MEFSAKKLNSRTAKTPCAVVFVQGNQFSESARDFDEGLNGLLTKLTKSKELGEKAGSTAWVSVPPKTANVPCERILLVQLGKAARGKAKPLGDDERWAKSVDAIAKSISSCSANACAIFAEDLISGEQDAETLGKWLAGALTKACYRYATTKNDVKHPLLKKCVLSVSQIKAAKRGLDLGAALGHGINTTRELGNLPGNICTPKYLANTAKKLAEGHASLEVKVLGQKQMGKLGMGAFLSVAKGSEEEGKLIVMEYKGAGDDSAPVALVGKGITFDTGGISLKPGPAMDEMKFDMCGAATVFGVVAALLEMKAKVNVVALVAAAENMPSGRASKPGDVVTTMSGQTVEILNTDAEGRLVLCDTLTYAERFKPKAVIDIATLTGACVIALGNHATGLFSNDDALANTLLDCGEVARDRAWRMPVWDEYQKQLDSNFADIANIGGREAGAITAACFLARFTKNFKWAHLDIAGTAWHSGKQKGASGRPVPLLVEYVLRQSA